MSTTARGCRFCDAPLPIHRYSACDGCLGEIIAGLHRRKDAEHRLPRLTYAQ